MSQRDTTEPSTSQNPSSRQGAPLGSIATKVHSEQSSNAQHLGLAFAPARRRVSQLLTKRDEDEVLTENHAPSNFAAASNIPNMRKRPRRRTIYIPPDDTTIMTIHPGLQSDNTALSGFSLQPEQSQLDERPQMGNDKRVDKRGAKRVSLAVAPRRVPLQPTLKPLQETDDQKDMAVTGPGKENVPPGLAAHQKAKTSEIQFPKARRISIFQPICEDVSEPGAHYGCQNRAAPIDRRVTSKDSNKLGSQRPPMPLQIAKPQVKKDRRASMMNRRNSLYYGNAWKGASNGESFQDEEAPPTKLVAATITQNSVHRRSQYQILEEDIEKPEMFEDAWLSDQESAMQQLLNRLFETAHEKVPPQQLDRGEFRGQLLHLYQDSNFALIYKRLQASLLYGALNPPQGSIVDTARLKTDVGLRQRFMAIWLGTYDLEALMSAAEVVVGRNISSSSSSPPSRLSGSHHSDDVKLRKRSAGLFIESCLLRNEDAHDEADMSNSLWCWRRTMLRCLMMVLLLDKAKERGSMPRNLFQRSSKYKSSRDILAALSALISPFLGDVTRQLSHLYYHIYHIQFPLSEYIYGIENLAVDLRDGIQLTHLVELLLYPPESSIGSRGSIPIAMPTGEVFTSSHDQGQPWPLSQHLKVPCLTSTQKTYNVQLALSALHGICGVRNIVEDIKAEDIVNGHREKTVTLLWSLIGTCGLGTMVDFEQVQKEIRRLSRNRTWNDELDSEAEDDVRITLEGPTKHNYLLKKWAQAIGRHQGLRVSNLTTAFSDGRVFAAIVDEYRRYLPRSNSSRSIGTDQLEVKLKDMGCSNAFGELL